MKADECDIVVEGGQEYVETEDGRYGLGLHFEEVKTQAFPTLASAQELMSRQEVIDLIESEDWNFGRAHFDDSYLTNQNGYGSCAGYAAASALTKARVLGGQERVNLSGDYAYSLVNRGRDNGSGLANNMRAMVKNGYASKETVPLGGIYPRKYNKAVADAEARRFRAHEPYALPDEQSFVNALATKKVSVHAIHVGRNWRRLDGDVLIGNKGVGNHSEHCDDIRYNRRKGRFEFRNGSSHKRPVLLDHLGRPPRVDLPPPPVLRRPRGPPRPAGRQPHGRRQRAAAGRGGDARLPVEQPLRLVRPLEGACRAPGPGVGNPADRRQRAGPRRAPLRAAGRRQVDYPRGLLVVRGDRAGRRPPAGMSLTEIIAAWLLADLLSGFGHWLEDTYCTAATPGIVGREICGPNLRHHTHQTEMLRGNFWRRNYTTFALAGVVVAIGGALGSPVVMLAGGFAALANETHAWAHRRPSHWLPRMLQEMGLVVSPQQHGKHHRPPHKVAYCTLSNLLNPVLDRLRVWRGLEQAIEKLTGRKPRSA